jgi:transcriptional regulator with XRE-family HTH domain
MSAVRAKPGRMTSEALRAALAALGLSQMACARLFGVNGTTAQRWARGEQDIPRAVELALNLMIKYRVNPFDLM